MAERVCVAGRRAQAAWSGRWVGRQGSPLGARWNSTSFSGHTTARGKEKGKEEVRREAQRRCRLAHQHGLCIGEKRAEGDPESSTRGLNSTWTDRHSYSLDPGREELFCSQVHRHRFSLLRCLSLAQKKPLKEIKSQVCERKYHFATNLQVWVRRVSSPCNVIYFLSLLELSEIQVSSHQGKSKSYYRLSSALIKFDF